MQELEWRNPDRKREQSGEMMIVAKWKAGSNVREVVTFWDAREGFLAEKMLGPSSTKKRAFCQV